MYSSRPRTHYAFDVVPAFWDWIVDAHAHGVVFTVERCAQEVIDGGDELADWMRNQPRSFRLAPGQTDQPSMRATSAWAASRLNYSQGARATFAGNGDFFLVAQVHAGEHTVVTHEGTHPDSKSRIMIPDACVGMGVPWMTPFQMLKAERVRFATFTTG